MTRDTAQAHPSTRAHADNASHKPEAATSRGLTLLHALFKHGDASPARIAELVAQNHPDEAAMMHEVQQRKGHSFVSKVAKAMKAAQFTDHRNIDMRDFVDGSEAGQIGTHARKPGKGNDPNRVTDDGELATLAIATNAYDSSGGVLGHAPANQKIKLQAGAMSNVAIKTTDAEGNAQAHIEACVLGFKVLDDGGNETVFGWIPISALGTDSHTAKILKTDGRIAAAISKAEHNKPKEYASVAQRVVLTAVPPALNDDANPLFTWPNQTKLKENRPRHYFARTAGGVNLLVNVPGSGPSRFGVPTDILAADAPFYRSHATAETHTPLWHGKEHPNHAMPIGETLTFVYGYTTHGDGSKRYGWINKACLA